MKFVQFFSQFDLKTISLRQENSCNFSQQDLKLPFETFVEREIVTSACKVLVSTCQWVHLFEKKRCQCGEK